VKLEEDFLKTMLDSKLKTMLDSKFWEKYFEVYDVLRKIELTPFFQTFFQK